MKQHGSTFKGRHFFTIPYVVWMAIFVVAPLILVVVYAFTSKSGQLTLDNFTRMGSFWAVFTRSILLALIATIICLLVGYPLACALAREGPRLQRIFLMLIMLPMWMNFLLRDICLDDHSGKHRTYKQHPLPTWPAQHKHY